MTGSVFLPKSRKCKRPRLMYSSTFHVPPAAGYLTEEWTTHDFQIFANMKLPGVGGTHSLNPLRTLGHIRP